VKIKMLMYHVRTYLTKQTLSVLIASFLMIWICAWLIYTYSAKAAARDVVIEETLPILSTIFAEAYSFDESIKQPGNETVDTLQNDFILHLAKYSSMIPNLSYNFISEAYECPEYDMYCSHGKQVFEAVEDGLNDAIVKAIAKAMPNIKIQATGVISDAFKVSSKDGVNSIVIIEHQDQNSSQCLHNSKNTVRYSTNLDLIGKKQSDDNVKELTTTSPKWSVISQLKKIKKSFTENRTETRRQTQTGCRPIETNGNALSLWFSLDYKVETPMYILQSGYSSIVYLVWLVFATMYFLTLRQGRKDLVALEKYTRNLVAEKGFQPDNIPKRIRGNIGLWRLAQRIKKLRSSLVSGGYFQERIGLAAHAMLKPSRKMYMRIEKLKARHDDMSAEKKDEYYKSLLNDAYYLHKLHQKILRLSRVLKINTLDQKNKSGVNIYDLFDKIKNDKKEGLNEKNITVNNNLPSEFILKADPELLESALELALDNAIKYNISDGSITIDQCGDAKSKPSIRIKNSGAGMSLEKIRHYSDVFSNSSPTSSALKGDIGSNGFGLQTIHEIMKLHGGAASICSNDMTSSYTCLQLTFEVKGRKKPQNIPATPIKEEPEEKVSDEVVFNPFPVGGHDYLLPEEKTNNSIALESEEVVDPESFDRPRAEGMKNMITTSGIGYVALAVAMFYFINNSF